MGFFVPLENFSLIWKRHHCRRRAANCDLCSTTMAIEQSGIFDVQHLLWHEPTLYSGHVRGPGTLTLAVGLSLPVWTTSANPEDKRYLYATAAVKQYDEIGSVDLVLSVVWPDLGLWPQTTKIISRATLFNRTDLQVSYSPSFAAIGDWLSCVNDASWYSSHVTAAIDAHQQNEDWTDT